MKRNWRLCKINAAFQGKQLSSYFNAKYKTGEFVYKHDLVYRAECPEESCNDDYIELTVK